MCFVASLTQEARAQEPFANCLSKCMFQDAYCVQIGAKYCARGSEDERATQCRIACAKVIPPEWQTDATKRGLLLSGLCRACAA